MNLSIAAFDPLWVGSNLVDDALAAQISGYTHTIAAVGGYTACEFSIDGNRLLLEDWFQNGLGRHIEVYNESLVKIWEGFVNEVAIQLGTLAATRGPLLGVANRVRVAYQGVTYNTNPPIGGEAAVTAAANNTDSQALYAIQQAIVSGGTGTATEMEQLRDTYLAEYGQPETSQAVNVGQAAAPVVTVRCVGYGQFLERYNYTETGSSGAQNLSDKLEAVLGDDPNSLISTNYDHITANTLQVGVYENQQQTALAIIQDLVARGDASDSRYTFGVYNDRQAYYEVVPTSITYEHLLVDREQRIQLVGGSRVLPWNVVPARWMLLADFLPGLALPGEPSRDDPRFLFIESVQYTAPWGLQITGGKVGTIAQKLAKLGLGGL